MTRRDTILIAVIINAGLLAVLFSTALIYDADKTLDQTVLSTPVVSSNDIPPVSETQLATVVPPEPAPVDEVDNVLSYYANPSQPLVVETGNEVFTLEPVESNSVAQEEAVVSSQADFKEIKVKKGDMLEKIARANGTTVSAIKKANDLKNEKLKIGQVLKIPLKADAKKVDAKKDEVAVAAPKEEKTEGGAVYYTIKSGDSPWKIAKQNNVDYEDILKLNGLDEGKARNLQVGEKIRIK